MFWSWVPFLHLELGPCVCVHIGAHEDMLMCVCVSQCTHAHVHAWMCVCVCIGVGMYACPHTCIYVHMGRSKLLGSDCSGPY